MNAATTQAKPARKPRALKADATKAASAARITEMTNAHMEAEFPARATDKEVKAAKKRAAAIVQLKDLARASYNDDAGFMTETYTDESYAAAIEEHGTALKAWKAHIAIHRATEETVDMEPADEAQDARITNMIIEQTDTGSTRAPEVKVAPPIPTTGYTGPMRALRDRVKAGAYKKAANGQPSCGDNVAQILGALEPKEVIRACLIAMDITNPYMHLNIGQQSMNLRNKLRGMMKRGEFGEGVLREAVEVVVESKAAAK